MDQQLKEILRQMIKYRFWIANGVAILLVMLGTFLSLPDVEDQTKKAVQDVEGAQKGLTSIGPGFKTSDYAKVVEEKTGDLGKVVGSTWRQLYDRQAPLLDWPEGFEDTFAKWGRSYPAGVDTSVIQNTIDAYKDAYPKYVTKVYNTVKPFNFEDGTGVVVAPPEGELLAPLTFSVSETPTLKQIWDAQEKLWLQRTILDVVANVNRDAKDWDSAVIKKIAGIDVATASAMDQVWNSKKPSTLTAAEKLQTSPPILPPGSPPPDPKAAEKAADAGGVQFMAPPGNQYRLYPVYLSVTMEQDHLQDLFTALQNSPMAIQITEVEVDKPAERVRKPQKGEEGAAGAAELGSYGGGGGGGGGKSYRPSRIGGSAAAMRQAMRGTEAQLKGFAGRNTGIGFNGPQSEGAKGLNAERGKISLREQNKSGKAQEEEKDKSKSAAKAEPAFDPYYDLVEVRINGIARFYNRPTDAPAAASPGDAPAPAANPANPAAPASPVANAPAPAPTTTTAPAAPAKAEPGKDAATAEDKAVAKDKAAPAATKDDAKGEGEAKKGDADAKGEAKPDAKGEAKADEKGDADAKPAPAQDQAKPAGDAGPEGKAAAPKAAK